MKLSFLAAALVAIALTACDEEREFHYVLSYSTEKRCARKASVTKAVESFKSESGRTFK